MKRQLYNLTDEPFAMLVDKVGTVLNDEKIPYNFVGGCAVQAYILDTLLKRTKGTICDLIHNPSIRIQDYLRSTDDIDMALKLEGDDFAKIRKINSFVPKFAFEDVAFCEEYIVEARPERVGASRPTFRIYKDGKGSQEEVVAMNIGRGRGDDIRHVDDEYYEKLIDESQELIIPYNSNCDLKIRVPRLEHLLSTKIAGSRAKDLMDIKNLADLSKEVDRKLDFKELSSILLPENEKNYCRFLESNYAEQLNLVYN